MEELREEVLREREEEMAEVTNESGCHSAYSWIIGEDVALGQDPHTPPVGHNGWSNHQARNKDVQDSKQSVVARTAFLETVWERHSASTHCF